jgi:hypothetical protein
MRERSKPHLSFVRTLRCTICGADPPSDPHHLKFVEPRAMSMKSGDCWVVPLCRRCHDRVENAGNEEAWWERQDIDPRPLAQQLWLISNQAKSATP